jgi:hypothetical protein
MSLDGMSLADIAAHEQDLLKLVRPGGKPGNVSLVRELGWPEPVYWSIRNRLIDRGLLERGRGRGGSVRLVVDPASAAAGPVEPPLADGTVQPLAQRGVVSRVSETDLYAPIAEVLKNQWALDNRYDESLVEVTALQGRRDTGGRWSRPDITMASMTVYAYVPGRHFDITTFEIKPPDGIDISVVYEALSHLRSATRAYAILSIPEGQEQDYDDAVAQICTEAKRHGIGVIITADPANYDTWEERVEAVRRDPDPERLNDFLAKQVSGIFRETIVKWFR